MQAQSISFPYPGLIAPPSPIIFIQFSQMPDELDTLVIYDYEEWSNGDDEEEEGVLLETDAIPIASTIPRSSNNTYYIRAYLDGVDHIHEVIHIPAHLTDISIGIQRTSDDEYEVVLSQDIERIEDAIV